MWGHPGGLLTQPGGGGGHPACDSRWEHDSYAGEEHGETPRPSAQRRPLEAPGQRHNLAWHFCKDPSGGRLGRGGGREAR